MYSDYPLDRFLTICQHELTNVVIEMPYSSCTPLVRAFHHSAPHEKFGDVCVHQLFRVTDRVSEQTGVQFEYLRDGRHLTGLARVNGTIVVVDPYLSHLQPLVFVEQPGVREMTTRAPAVPTVSDTSGEARIGYVEATWDSLAAELDIRQAKWSNRHRCYRTSRQFHLSMSNTVDRALTGFDYRPFLFHPERRTLSVRYVDPVDLVYLDARLPLAGGGPVEYRINSEPISRETESWFWCKINRYGHVDRLELDSFLRTAYNCYWENKGEWELPTYDM